MSQRSPDCATRNPGLTARLAPDFVSLNPGYVCYSHQMGISPAIRRRIKWGIGIGTVLVVAVVTLLTYADTFAVVDHTPRCALGFWKTQWPKYFGCAMATHEGLAGALWGAAGVLWAAWLAFQAVQEQIAEEKDLREQQQRIEQERRTNQQIEAKKVAVATLTRAVSSAGAALVLIERAIASDNPMAKANLERRLHEGGITSLMEDALKSFVIRDISRELAVNDRIRFLEIVEALATFVSVCRASEPAGNVTVGRLLESLRKELTDFSRFLAPFDTQLAEVFTRYRTLGTPQV
jgi:hypothetical protein